MNKTLLALIATVATAASIFGVTQIPSNIKVDNHRMLVGSAMMGKLNRAFPSLAADQKANAQAIIDYAAGFISDQNALAYVLSTAIGESNLRPIKEIRARVGTKLRTTQDKYWSTNYFGRGYVQLTWKTNYEKFSSVVGANLVANPDLALNA